MKVSYTSIAFLLLFVAAISQSPSQAQAVHRVSEIWQRTNQMEALNQYPNLREDVLNAMTSLEDLWTVYLPALVESVSKNNSTISDACYKSTMAIILGSNLLQPNVTMPKIVPLLDATGKQGAGLLGGNYILDAAFDECFEYNYTGYCMGKVDLSFLPPTIPFSWTAGLCIPKHCSSSDVAAVMNFSRVFKVDENAMKCTNTKTPAYSSGAIVMIVVCVVLGVLVATGTILDMVLRYMAISGSGENIPLLTQVKSASMQHLRKVKWDEFITAFSLYKTVPTLLATKQASSIITSMNGLRVISMFWVILGHTYVTCMDIGIDNVHSLQSLLRRFSFQAVANFSISVDSFFFLSGVLVAYLTLGQMKKRNGRFPFLHYYAHRYLRLTPTYAFVLFFAWFLVPHIVAGPTFALEDPYGPQCAKYWWTNLLYISNIYPWKMKDQCLVWTWYLANDMQFFIISPLMLIPAYFLLPLGVVVSIALLLCSFIVTTTLVLVFNIVPAGVFVTYDLKYISKFMDLMDLIYEKPWMHVQPYIVGLSLGYVLYRGVRLPFHRKINTLLYFIMWMAIAVLLASPVYGLYSQVHGYIATTAENVMYTTFSRCSWGLGLALLMFTCHNGYGGVINTFLSMKIWTPLTRMTFNAYLVHPIVQKVIYGQLQKTVHVTELTMATFIVAFVVISYAVAGMVCVVVEFPLGSVEILIFKLLGLEGREGKLQGPVSKKEEEGEKNTGQENTVA